MTEYESFADPVTDQPSRSGDIQRKRARPARKKKSGGLPVALAWLVALFTGSVVCWTVIVAINPDSPINPFKAAEAPTPTLFVIPSITPTPPTLPPTWTPAPTLAFGPTQTFMVLPSATPTAVETLNIAVEAVTSEPTATLSLFQYTQAGSVSYAPNGNGEGCAWMSIAGTVKDINGNFITGLAIVVRGDFVESLGWTGSATRFGPSGYEVQLNNSPYVATWSVQVFDRNAQSLSDAVNVQTSSDCRKNVTMVNFQQNH